LEFQPTSLIDSMIQISDTIQDENSRSGFATEDFDVHARLIDRRRPTFDYNRHARYQQCYRTFSLSYPGPYF
jgi:hypothetical protein